MKKEVLLEYVAALEKRADPGTPEAEAAPPPFKAAENMPPEMVRKMIDYAKNNARRSERRAVLQEVASELRKLVEILG